MIIQKRITRKVVENQMINLNHEEICSYLSSNFQRWCVAVIQCGWTVTHMFRHSQLCWTCLRHLHWTCLLQNFMWLHPAGYHHVSFLQSYDHGNFQLCTCRGRSNVIESSCLSMQSIWVKAQPELSCLFQRFVATLHRDNNCYIHRL